MGRPSLETERREQILDAVQDCIVEVGLGDVTMDMVAERAGMHRPAITHFIGNRDEVLQAAYARSPDYYKALLHSIRDLEPAEQLAAVLDLIGGDRTPRAAMILFDELVPVAQRDPDVRARLTAATDLLYETVADALGYEYPDADAATRRDVANALTLLIDNAERFRVVGLDASRDVVGQTRRAAALLLAQLDDGSSR